MLNKFLPLIFFLKLFNNKKQSITSQGNRHPSVFIVIGYYFEYHSTIVDYNRFESICPNRQIMNSIQLN